MSLKVFTGHIDS